MRPRSAWWLPLVVLPEASLPLGSRAVLFASQVNWPSLLRQN